MSWKETLLPASWRGVVFDVAAERLSNRWALAQHGMPYRDGDAVEDMGREARRFSMRAVVWGDDYELALQRLLDALDAPGAGELVHPIYGSVTAVVESCDVDHDAERPDYAELSMVFVESVSDPAFFERVFTPTEGAIRSAFDDGEQWQDKVRDLFSRVDGLVSVVQTYTGAGWVGLAGQLLGLPGIGVRLAQLRSQTLGVLAGLADFAGTSAPSFDPLGVPSRVPVEISVAVAAAMPYVPAADTGDLLLDARALIAGNALPRQIPGSNELPPVAVRAWSTVIDASRRQDALRLSTDGASGGTLLDLPTGMPADALTAQALGLTLLAVSEQAVALASATSTVLDAELQAPALTPSDIERLVGQTRVVIEGAILLHRRLYTVEPALKVIEPLRDIAALLQAAARRVILAKPSLIERVVESDACLRSLAHRWYGDHTRSAELLRLNPHLRSPYAISRGEVLRAYAA